MQSLAYYHNTFKIAPILFFVKLGLDCDDTLMDFIEGLPAAYNQRYGTSYRVTDLSPDFADLRQVLGDEGYKNLEEMFLDESFVLGISPVPGAVEGVNSLREKGMELYVVSHRQGAPEEVTLRSLHQYFGDTFQEVIFTYGKPKGEICRKRGIELFVDDLPQNIVSVNQAGIPALLYNRHWNQEVIEHALVKRVKNWKAVVREAEKWREKIEG